MWWWRFPNPSGCVACMNLLFINQRFVTQLLLTGMHSTFTVIEIVTGHNYTNYSFLKVWVLCTVTAKKRQCCNKVTVHRRKHCPVILLIGYCGFKQLSHCLQEFVPQVINIEQRSFHFSQPLGKEMFRSFCIMRFKIQTMW